MSLIASKNISLKTSLYFFNLLTILVDQGSALPAANHLNVTEGAYLKA